MVTTGAIIQFLYPSAVGLTDYTLDPVGAVVSWNSAKLGVQPTAQQLADAVLPATKASAIAANRAECSNRIYERYPAGRQLSALAGIYDAANVSAMHDWIASCIAAENTAADLIEAATTVQAVEAVTVAWPV